MAPAKSFDKLPSGAASIIEPYQLRIPDEDVQHLRHLLKLSPVASQIYENSLPNGDRRYGARYDWLTEAKRTWETNFDWRATENHVNSFPNFRATINDKIGDFSVHFVALFSTKADAVPVILLHGWPGSFLEFLPMLELFRKEYSPETLPYHLIVPSLPGFTLSPMPLLEHNINQIDAARIMNQLMGLIGFGNGYVAQGGDVGSRVARVMAVNHEECKAVHLNLVPMNAPKSQGNEELSKLDQENLKRADHWKATGTAYALEHATRPSTIGFVLTSSPVALLSWIGEKYLEWTDEDPTLNTILEACSLYWLTKSAHSSLWSYRHSFGAEALFGHDDAKYYIKKPFGYSCYPKEITATPVSWAASTGNLVWSKVHDKGGHFAALEQPQDFKESLEDFIAKVW